MSFTFNSNDLTQYIDYVNRINGLEMPGTKDFEVEVLQKHGNFYSQTTYLPRVITLQVTLLSSATKTIYQRFDDLKKILVQSSEKVLTLPCFTDRYIMARYSGSMMLNQGKNIMEITISFKCSYPFFYSNSAYLQNIYNGTNTVHNAGTINSDFLYLMVKLPYNLDVLIRNNTTNQSLTLNNNLGPGTIDALVDFKTGTITSLNGVSNYIRFYKAGTYFSINADDNNINCVNLATGDSFILFNYAFI